MGLWPVGVLWAGVCLWPAFATLTLFARSAGGLALGALVGWAAGFAFAGLALEPVFTGLAAGFAAALPDLAGLLALVACFGSFAAGMLGLGFPSLI